MKILHEATRRDTKVFFFFFVPLRVTSWRIFEGAFKEIINPAGCSLTLRAAEMPGRLEPD
jgi:hypothetical protein